MTILSKLKVGPRRLETLTLEVQKIAEKLSRPKTPRIWLALDVTNPPSFWLSCNYFSGKVTALSVKSTIFWDLPKLAPPEDC